MVQEKILAQFRITPPYTVHPIAIGLVNQTFLVEKGGNKYILQKLHPIVTPQICENAKVITEHLSTSGIPVPTYILSLENNPYYETEGSVWRLTHYLPGISVTVSTLGQIRSAAEILGKTHKLLKKLLHPCEGSIPHFHDTKYIAEEKNVAEIRESIEFVLEKIPNNLLPENLPAQIIHGDPKITNFLFEKNTVSALLDFDICCIRSPLIDIGDALRSWCKDMNAHFEKEKYDTAVSGYLASNLLSEKEVALIPQALRLITLEQATRYLIDYLENTYYAWDNSRFPSRAAHNRFRAEQNIAFYKEVAEKVE